MPPMDNIDPPVVDPNAASAEELRQLPGIGPELADRIIADRPYADLDDLGRVTGLGDSVIAALDPYLYFGAKAEELEQSSTEPISMVPTEPGRSPGLWALLAVAAASVACSVTLTLAILAGINGTLSVERNAALQEARGELHQVQSELETAQSEVEALRGRTEALEGVRGRVAEVEGRLDTIEREIEGALGSVERMQSRLDTALEETRAQAERVNRFQAFLEGLGQLLGRVASGSEP